MATGYGSGDIVWYENNHPDWLKYKIDNRGEGVGIGMALPFDVDGDDTLDVVSGLYDQELALVWYENKHPSWPQHVIDKNCSALHLYN